ncbi:hypothetical protein HKW97_23160 (plasmid) [Pseudomonas luteola]|uniref:OsmC family protein n=1 Tax=Pseudomonas luteola TaxID=47886 RepID=UPI00388E87EC
MMISTSWNGNLLGSGSSESANMSIPLALPSEFGGTGMAAGPKDLFVASTAACFLMTLRVMLAMSSIEPLSLKIESHVSVEAEKFAITHHAYITLEKQADFDRTLKIVIMADKNCWIGSLAKKAGVAINVIPELTVQV